MKSDYQSLMHDASEFPDFQASGSDLTRLNLLLLLHSSILRRKTSAYKVFIQDRLASHCRCKRNFNDFAVDENCWLKKKFVFFPLESFANHPCVSPWLSSNEIKIVPSRLQVVCVWRIQEKKNSRWDFFTSLGYAAIINKVNEEGSSRRSSVSVKHFWELMSTFQERLDSFNEASFNVNSCQFFEFYEMNETATSGLDLQQFKVQPMTRCLLQFKVKQKDLLHDDVYSSLTMSLSAVILTPTLHLIARIRRLHSWRIIDLTFEKFFS